jgi:hypothetical protein
MILNKDLKNVVERSISDLFSTIAAFLLRDGGRPEILN